MQWACDRYRHSAYGIVRSTEEKIGNLPKLFACGSALEKMVDGEVEELNDFCTCIDPDFEEPEL